MVDSKAAIRNRRSNNHWHCGTPDPPQVILMPPKRKVTKVSNPVKNGELNDNCSSLNTIEPKVVSVELLDPVLLVYDNGSSPHKILRPESSKLLDDMLHPLPLNDFLRLHFRKNAVCIQRRAQVAVPRIKKSKGNNGLDPKIKSGNREMVDYISKKFLFDLDIRKIFAETSSDNVFLWLRPPSTSSTISATQLNSVEISDPETAYALHQAGSHPAYCRAPPQLEQLLVNSLLRSTGLGGGHYHFPHSDTVTLGGGTTLGRGEVELFIGTKASNGDSHITGAHTDFQENFTIQLSGVKQWTLRRGRVKHPLRATTPHYFREASVVENQLKAARLCCEKRGLRDTIEGRYGFEYDENNAYGQEQTITLYPGDVLYFPAGMWHTVKTIEQGVSLNVSLMGTTYAKIVCDALQHVLVGRDEKWREVIMSSPGDVNGSKNLQNLMESLSKVVDDFVISGGGAQSILPPVLCYPPLECKSEECSVEDAITDSIEERVEDKNMWNDETNSESETSFSETLSTEIIVNMDTFEGPSGWSCGPSSDKAKLIKNPLATLMSLDDVAVHIIDKSNFNDSKSNGRGFKKYILNVNFAGSEMHESYIRVIFETRDHIRLMEQFLKNESIEIGDHAPPECLIYYGFLCWI